MDERTKAALEGSIAKWRGISERTVVDEGSANCPLCQAFPAINCAGCPVATRVGKSGCVGTPYDEWEWYRVSDPAKYPDEAIEVARAELAFLESLREEKQ